MQLPPKTAASSSAGAGVGHCQRSCGVIPCSDLQLHLIFLHGLLHLAAGVSAPRARATYQRLSLGHPFHRRKLSSDFCFVLVYNKLWLHPMFWLSHSHFHVLLFKKKKKKSKCIVGNKKCIPTTDRDCLLWRETMRSAWLSALGLAFVAVDVRGFPTSSSCWLRSPLPLTHRRAEEKPEELLPCGWREPCASGNKLAVLGYILRTSSWRNWGSQQRNDQVTQQLFGRRRTKMTHFSALYISKAICLYLTDISPSVKYISRKDRQQFPS